MAKWIWCDNDFELFLYHNLLKRRRQRKGLLYPIWQVDSPNYHVWFQKEYDIPEDTSFKIYHSGKITVNVNESPWDLELLDDVVHLKKGKGVIRIYAFCDDTFPCVYINDKYIATDESWLIYSSNVKWKKPNCSDSFNSEKLSPLKFALPRKKRYYIDKKAVSKGTVYDFGKEIIAFPVFVSNTDCKADVYYGESYNEAIDFENSEVYDTFNLKKGKKFVSKENRAFRYVFIPKGCEIEEFYVYEEVYQTEFSPSFVLNDKKFNDIYKVAEYTLRLTSREFFIDGPKRDRWTWAGDALQSELFDFYSFFDKNIIKRTISGILGRNYIHGDISGVFDYNFYIIVAVYLYYKYTADDEFLMRIYPKLKSLMSFLQTKPYKDGFIYPEPSDWIFIDWVDYDDMVSVNISDAVSIIQILYYTCLEFMVSIEKKFNLPVTDKYLELLDGYKERINNAFYDADNGVFYHDKNRTLKTKYGNIFAVILGFANEGQKQAIKKSFCDNGYKQITTPYMKFYELLALGELGETKKLLDYMYYYWGGMIDLGATTFWEKYIPEQTGDDKYAMYGRKYGKSLCHSWGAGPLCLFGKFVAGLFPLTDGYATYGLKPYLEDLKFKSELPVNGGTVKVEYDGKTLIVYSKEKDGVLFTDKKLKGNDLEFDDKLGGYILRKGVKNLVSINQDGE